MQAAELEEATLQNMLLVYEALSMLSISYNLGKKRGGGTPAGN